MSEYTDRRSVGTLLTEIIEEADVRLFSESSNRRRILEENEINFSDKFLKRLLELEFSSHQDLGQSLFRILNRLYPSQEDENKSFKALKDTMATKGFTEQFAKAFERVALRQIARSSDTLILHFSEEMYAEEAFNLETILNDVARQTIQDNESIDKLIKDSIVEDNSIFRIRSYDHPTSTEYIIILLITGTIARIVKRSIIPLIQTIAINLQFDTISAEDSPPTTSPVISNLREPMRNLQEVNVQSLIPYQQEVYQRFQNILNDYNSGKGDYLIVRSPQQILGVQNN